MPLPARLWRVVLYVVTIAFSIVFMFPFVWTLSSSLKTAYEIDRYEGDRRTLVRALEFMDGVNEEIIQLIYDQWPSKREGPESLRKGSTT